MDSIDPRFQEIMAKISGSGANKAGKGDVSDESKAELLEKEKAKKVKPPKPPLTYDEFIKAEKMDEWPVRLTSENLLDLSDERQLIGSPSDIIKQLKEATPIDMQMLKDLEDRLAKFDNTLCKYSDMMLASEEEVKAEVVKDNFPLSVNRAFLTDMHESDALKAHPSRKRKALDFKDQVLESQKKSVEHCEFPGFRHGELTELPGNLEAPQILHRVTKAQDFNPGFRKFWKKIFQSEASIAMMQDAFWWIFIELFQQKNKKKLEADQGYLFDRLADSFVALFTSVHPDIKDKVFSAYPDCLAQSVFAAFWEAFPESHRYFQESFRQFLCNISSEWISGIKTTPGTWKKWAIKDLESKNPKHTAEMGSSAPAPNTEAKQPESFSLATEEFLHMVDRLGESSVQSRGETILPLTRDPTRLTLDTTLSRQQQQLQQQTKHHNQSSVMGPGPEMERSLFNLQSGSPLVAHYLYMRQLKHNHKGGKQRVRRTEISKMPPTDLPTYRDLIEETEATSNTLSKEYQRVCDMTAQEIMRIEKTQRKTNRKIAKLQKELMFCKNNLEVKIMSERLLGKQEVSETPRLALKDTEEDEDY